MKKDARITFKCEGCGTLASDCRSHYARKKHHFCKKDCYNAFQRTRPREEHPRYGGRKTIVYPNTPPAPFEKRFCPVCPGKQPLGHCWEPEFRPKDYKGTHPSYLHQLKEAEVA